MPCWLQRDCSRKPYPATSGLFLAAISSGIAGGARGIINAIGNLGGFLGPFMVGWIGTLFGMKVGIYTLVFFLLAGAALTMLLPEVTAGKKPLANAARADK